MIINKEPKNKRQKAKRVSGGRNIIDYLQYNIQLIPPVRLTQLSSTQVGTQYI